MKLILHLLITAGALLLAAYLIPGIAVTGFVTAVIAALCLGVLNLLVRPILTLLTLPINLITFGLFSFVISALLFWFAAAILDGFAVDGFIPALLGSILVSVVSSLGRELTS